LDSDSTGACRQSRQQVKDCWNACDYPSECRWGKRFGVHTPVVTEFPTIEIQPTPPPPPPPPSTTFEGILKPENCKDIEKEKKGEKTDFWGALVASATRRKSVPPSSPLASVTEEGGASEPSNKDGDGDVVMTTVDPALIPQPLPNTSPANPSSLTSGIMPMVTLKDIIRKSTKLVSGKASPKLPAVKEESKVDSMQAVSSSEEALSEFDFEFNEIDKYTVELSPLTRVESKDSGYCSSPDIL
jgi:hypothetical protein